MNNTITIISISVSGLIAVISLILMILNRRKYNKNIIQINSFVDSLKIPSMKISERLEFENNLMDFIDRLIELEVFNEKRFELILGVQDKKIDIDDVMKTVSKRVFDSIKPDIYTDANNIVTDKYLMLYIQKRTFIYCMKYMANDAVEQE